MPVTKRDLVDVQKKLTAASDLQENLDMSLDDDRTVGQTAEGTPIKHTDDVPTKARILAARDAAVATFQTAAAALDVTP